MTEGLAGATHFLAFWSCYTCVFLHAASLKKNEGAVMDVEVAFRNSGFTETVQT